MNGTPPSPSRVAPKMSAPAVTSLALGIFGLGLSALVCSSFFSGIFVYIAMLSFAPLFFTIPAIVCGHIAHSRIKNSGGQIGGRGMAMVGLVTGYAGLALMVLPLSAVPSVISARKNAPKHACINNLRFIDAAKHQWALEHPDKKDTVPRPADLDPYLTSRGGFNVLKCPMGGTYDIKPLTAKPTCSTPGHILE